MASMQQMKNVQKDPEASAAWVLKDEVLRRGKVYYGKLVKGNSMFLAPRMIPYFNAIWGVPKNEEKDVLSANAQKVLKPKTRKLGNLQNTHYFLLFFHFGVGGGVVCGVSSLLLLSPSLSVPSRSFFTSSASSFDLSLFTFYLSLKRSF